MAPALHLSPHSPEIIVLGPHDNFGLRKQAFRQRAMRMAAKSLPTVETGDCCSDTEEGDCDFDYVYEEEEQQQQQQENKKGQSKSTSKPPRSPKKSPPKPKGDGTPPPPPPPEDEASPSSKKTTKMQKTGSGEKKIVKSSPKASPKASLKKANKTSPKPVSSDATAPSSSKGSPSTSPSQSLTPGPTPRRAPRRKVVILKDPSQGPPTTAATTTSSSNSTSSPREPRNTIRRCVSDDGTGSNPSLRKPRTPRSLPGKSASLDENHKGVGKPPLRRVSSLQYQDGDNDEKTIQDKMAKLETKNKAATEATSNSNNHKDEKKGVFRAMRSKLFSSK